MRQKYIFVRLLLVCLLLVGFIQNSSAQNDNKEVTEGSLQVVGKDGKLGGLFPLKDTKVDAEISGFISRVTVTQTFQNPFTETIEAVYAFPLPNDAAVNDMTIQIGDRIVKGKILEREKAKEVYEKAKEEGKVAALLEQQRPNIFTQTVANITPYAEIKVIISYIETLKYADGIYEFSFPMTIGERYIPVSKSDNPNSSSETGVSDADKISPPSIESDDRRISINVNLDAGVSLENISSNTHQIETAMYSASKASVRLKNEDEIPNRDFVLRYKTAGEQIKDSVLTHTSDKGGYFALILQPPDKVFPQDATPKEIIFVLDRSGSMDGFPLEKAVEAMKLAIEGLNPNDTFNIIVFSDDTKKLFDNPVLSTPNNLAKAKKLLSESTSGGGTELMKAMKAALEPGDSQSRVRIVCFMTDGDVGNDFEIIDEVKKHPEARVFSFGIGVATNRYIIDEMARIGRGEAQYLNQNDDSSEATKRFYERIRNPLLTDISIDWNGLPVSEIYPKRIPDLFDAKPLIIVGRYNGEASGNITLKGNVQEQVFSREIPVSFSAANEENSVLSTLWARQKVADLLTQDLSGLQRNEFNEELKQVIINLGLDYRLLTQFTSFVAVEERIVTDGTGAKTIEVPVIIPKRLVYVDGYGGGVNAMVSVSGSRSSSINASSSSIQTNVTETNSPENLTRGKSMQSTFSNANGITQTNESSAENQKGLISSNGQRPTSNNFKVDDLSANFGLSLDETSISNNAGTIPNLTTSGGTNSILPLNATEEVTVKTNANAKEQRVAGASINFVSKGGTNAFHGSLFENFGNEVFNANDFFANSRNLERSANRLNQFGGTLGGYFKKDKSWFFTNYEGLRLRQNAFQISEVPSLASRQNASPNMRSLLEAFPIPNGENTSNGFAEFASTYTNPTSNDIFGFKIDNQINNNLRISGRYNFADSDATIRGDRDFSLNTLRQIASRNHSFSSRVVAILSPGIVLYGKVNFSRNNLSQQFSLDTFGGANISSNALNLPFDFLKYDLNGKNSAIANGNENKTTINQFQAITDLTWIIGDHTFSFGGEYRRLSLDIFANATERNVLFAGVIQNTNDNALQISELQRQIPQNPNLTNFSLYAQDNWRISNDFTLSLGLRWDTDFSPKLKDSEIILQNASTQMPDNFANFAPRIGFAYDIFGSGNSVIRVGVGKYFDFGNAISPQVFANSFPFISGNFAQNTNFLATPQNTLNPLAVFERDLKTPNTWQIFTQFQQEFSGNIFSAAYVGTFGRELFLTRTIYDENPIYNFIRTTNNDAESNYHSAQFKFERRFLNGFSINGNYTLSKSTDNYSVDSFRENNLVSQNLEQDRAVSDFDIRHNLSIYGSYELPTFFDGGILNKLTKNWSIYGFANTRSAFPINVTYTNINIFGKQNVRPNLIEGVPVYLGEGNENRINPNAFSIPTDSNQGNLERNSLRGNSLFNLDFGLQRKIEFSNDMNVKLSFQALNLLNNTNFADRNNNLGTIDADGNLVKNSYFGQTTSTFGSQNFTPFYLYGGARILQFSAKFEF